MYSIGRQHDTAEAGDLHCKAVFSGPFTEGLAKGLVNDAPPPMIKVGKDLEGFRPTGYGWTTEATKNGQRRHKEWGQLQPPIQPATNKTLNW
jgi:hypothetical protein